MYIILYVRIYFIVVGQGNFGKLIWREQKTYLPEVPFNGRVVVDSSGQLSNQTKATLQLIALLDFLRWGCTLK